MADPYSLPQITDLAIGAAAVDILREQATALMDEDSIVLLFANRESVDVTIQIKSGGFEVYPVGPASINAVLGDMPIIPDDLLYRGVVKKGERIQALGTNVNAAAQELRVLAMIVALSDAAALPQLISVAG